MDQAILNALIVTAYAESVGLKHHIQVGADETRFPRRRNTQLRDFCG